MSQSNAIPTTSRRALLAGVPAAALSGAGLAGCIPDPAPAAEPNPDRLLIDLCFTFDGTERRIQALDRSGKPGSELERRTLAEETGWLSLQDPLVDAVCKMPPQTREGARALAASCALHLELAADDDPDAPRGERMVAALLRGLIGGQA